MRQSIPRRPSVSVVICTHNGQRRLPQCLKYLARQTVDEGIAWELMVVDNASTDSSLGTAQQCWARKDVPMRFLEEPNPGQALARLKALVESRMDLVSLIDDDNWVDCNWVTEVSNIMRDHPKAGACGGMSVLNMDKDPPVWFANNAKSYAVGTQGEKAGDTILWGAGLTVRRSAFEALYEQGFRPRAVSRPTGEGALFKRLGLINPLRDGGDSELCLALRIGGWELWYEPGLKLEHHIDPARLTWSNHCKILRGFGWAHVGLSTYEAASSPNNGLVHTLSRRWWVLAPWYGLKLIGAIARAAPALWSGREGARTVLHMEYRFGYLLALISQRAAFGAAIWQLSAQPWMRRQDVHGLRF